MKVILLCGLDTEEAVAIAKVLKDATDATVVVVDSMKDVGMPDYGFIMPGPGRGFILTRQEPELPKMEVEIAKMTAADLCYDPDMKPAKRKRFGQPWNSEHRSKKDRRNH